MQKYSQQRELWRAWREESYKAWYEARNLLHLIEEKIRSTDLSIPPTLRTSLVEISSKLYSLLQKPWYSWSPLFLGEIIRTRNNLEQARDIITSTELSHESLQEIDSLIEETKRNIYVVEEVASKSVLRFLFLGYSVMLVLIVYLTLIHIVLTRELTLQEFAIGLIGSIITLASIIATRLKPAYGVFLLVPGIFLIDVLLVRLKPLPMLQLVIGLPAQVIIIIVLVFFHKYYNIEIDIGKLVSIISQRELVVKREAKPSISEQEAERLMNKLVKEYTRLYGEQGRDMLEYDLRSLEKTGLSRLDAIKRRAEELGLDKEKQD